MSEEKGKEEKGKEIMVAGEFRPSVMLPETRKISFMELSLPAAKEAAKKQKEMVSLAESLLEEEDYAYLVIFIDVVDKEKPPQMIASKELAENWAREYKEKTGKNVKIVRTKLKSAWLRLGLHLGITVPPGQEMVPVDKEVQPIGDNMICIKTTGPGYKSVTILGLMKTPDGRFQSQVMHSETTATLYWRGTDRISVRSGACGYIERKFAHKIHDVIAMAETRAFSRTMACLLGFGETTAEEYEEIEPEIKPRPKDTSKPKEKSQEKKGKKKSSPAKDAPPKEEKKNDGDDVATRQGVGDDLATRQGIVKASADAVGNAKQVLNFFDDWKLAQHGKDNDFDIKTLMSRMSDENWVLFKADLLAWVKESSGVEIQS